MASSLDNVHPIRPSEPSAPLAELAIEAAEPVRRPPAPEPKAADLGDARHYLNRELSWLAFNERVLGEAQDDRLPILERLKFLSIVASNLDEFFMVRVAGLKQQIAGQVADAPPDGLLPPEQLARVSEKCHAQVASADRLWLTEIRPALSRHGLELAPAAEWNAEQRAAVRAFFSSQVFPALTPLAVDPGHPFPHLRNKSLNVAVSLRPPAGGRRKGARTNLLAVVQVPGVLGRLRRLPSAEGQTFALLEDIIAAHVGDLFPGYSVRHTAAFRVTRNWDLLVDDEDSEDLLSTVQEELRRRDRGAAVRLEIADQAPAELERALAGALSLGPADVYPLQAPLQPQDLLALGDLDPRPELRVEPHTPVMPLALRDARS
ncbi:MAG: polyphosphate kinase, partial [Deltaproteobacteria bacterium]